MDSKAHPDARHRGVGFKIGDAFPADDPIARWATVLAMAANNTIYLNVRIIEGDLPPELDMYYFRLLAAHFLEAAQWLQETRSRWPEIDELIRHLDPESQKRFDRIVAYASQRHPVHHQLRRSRSTLFHYPTLHPAREDAGAEELANAMRQAKDLDGWIEAGDEYASFRASFADEVAVQFLADGGDAAIDVMDSLAENVFDLVKFAEVVLYEQLKRVPAGKTTIWRRGDPKPGLPK